MKTKSIPCRWNVSGRLPTLSATNRYQAATDSFVSLGANVTFQVTATGAGPLAMRGVSMPRISSIRERSLVLTTCNSPRLRYAVVVTDSSGSVTSHVAHLDVDPPSPRSPPGRIVNDGGFSIAAAWGDYDDDGFYRSLCGELG